MTFADHCSQQGVTAGVTLISLLDREVFYVEEISEADAYFPGRIRTVPLRDFATQRTSPHGQRYYVHCDELHEFEVQR